MLLCAVTVTWNMVVGGAAVLTAVVTGSLVLIGFGLNAVVDSSVSALLVWRFRAEETGHAERAEGAERIALRAAAVAFILIALYLVIQSTRAVLSSSHAKATVFAVAEAGASLVVLPILAHGKYTLARRLDSRALRADSLLTCSGVALAAAALIALVLRRAIGWWWADPAAALVIAVLLADQGRRALLGAPPEGRVK
jgi:divalent metal cation (Fe/Co/Zn/Cd) transporter